MPYFVAATSLRGPLTEREAAELLAEEGNAGCVLVRGELVPFAVEVVRRVIVDPAGRRQQQLFDEGCAATGASTSAPTTAEPRKHATGKYGGRTIPDQILEYMAARPGDHRAGDIAADIAVPRESVHVAFVRLRRKGVIERGVKAGDFHLAPQPVVTVPANGGDAQAMGVEGE